MPQLPTRRKKRFAIRRPAGALVALAMLSACTDPISVAVSGASVVSVVQTGKTLSDHAMSAATGMDCSIRNSIAGIGWCQPALSDTPDPAADLACYRSIAEVTCYARDNPYETASRRTQ